MGNSASFETNLQTKSSNIKTQHSDIDETVERINAEADRLIALIIQRKYNDREGICKKIGYQKVDELSGLFQTQTLNGVRYRLGIIPENTPELEANKQKVCLDIVNFYLKKINLISNIQKELPNCKDMERNIYDNLAAKLGSRDLNDEQWLQVYNKIEKFNKEISSRYGLFERELERVRRARNMRELDTIAVTTNSILAKTNNICKNYEHDLIEFSNKSMEKNQAYSPRPEIEKLKRDIAERKREEQVIRQEIREETPSPSIRSLPFPEEQKVRFDLSRQLVERKKEEGDLEKQLSELVQEQKQTKSILKVPKEKEELPTIPVEETPLVPPLEPFPIQTTIKADRIIKSPRGTIIQNPQSIKRTEYIPKEKLSEFHRSLTPGNKTISLEPVYNVKARGVPVRAVKEFLPQRNGQLELRKGQATLFLGKGQNGWSMVKHSDGRTGVVPHSYLSK